MAPVLELACPRCGRLHDAETLVCALCGNLLRREQQAASGASCDAGGSPPDDTSPAEDDRGARPASPAAVTPAAVTPGSVTPGSLTLGSPSDPRFATLRQLIPSAPAYSPARDVRPSTLRAPTPSDAPRREEGRDRREGREPWIYLAIGLATAPVFALTPILSYMGWFLASLVHEMGHAAFAWTCGMPAVPAISLAGHAAALHAEQSLFLAFLIGTGLAAGAWRLFAGRWRWIALALFAVGYPSIALTGARELLHLLAGHAAELAFATLCLWKTLDGGFTESKLERGLYGTVGWYLLGRNAHLCWGLLRSTEARAEYNENGSFGLTNDYIRAAEDVLSCPLEHVALAMLLASLFVLPAAWLAWRVTRALRRA